MKRKKEWLSIVTVEATAPKGYKPHKITYNFCYVTTFSPTKLKDALIAGSIGSLEIKYKKICPDIHISISGSIQTMPIVGIMNYDKVFSHEKKL